MHNHNLDPHGIARLVAVSYLHPMDGFLLLRHARASWPQPGHKDFERPLSDSGRLDVSRMAAAMSKSGIVPDSVLCSPARRAKETWQQLSDHFPGVPVTYVNSLYEGDANAYLGLVRAATNSHKPLIIGHNPMLEDLALALSANYDAKAREQLQAGFPACGLAIFDVKGDLSGAGPDTARLSQFMAPQAA